MSAVALDFDPRLARLDVLSAAARAALSRTVAPGGIVR